MNYLNIPTLCFVGNTHPFPAFNDNQDEDFHPVASQLECQNTLSTVKHLLSKTLV